MFPSFRRAAFLVVFSIPFVSLADEGSARRTAERIDAAVAGAAREARAGVVEAWRRELGGVPAPATAPIPAAVEAALAAIRVEPIRRDVAFLAADDLEGRNSGEPGGDRAAAHVAAAFRAAGLEPAGDDGDWFQAFDFTPRGGEPRSTGNVIGRLPGSDPALAGEIVVVGAHYDHVGRQGQANPGRSGKAAEGDDIWNGADDNASGTSALLAIARAFAAKGVRPRRTVLFIAFGAEEYGLHGSRYYVRNPVAPLDRHVAMVNLDMVGRNPGRPLSVSETDTAGGGLFDRLLDEANVRTGLKVRTRPLSPATGGSDHVSFRARGIPVAFFFTGLHADYHRATDHADRIDYGRLESIARLAFLFARSVADLDERPRYAGPPVRAK